jgi:hypothetical protein
MKNLFVASLLAVVLLPAGLALAHGAGTKPVLAGAEEVLEADEEVLITLRVPLKSQLFSSTPVAVVNEEPITFRDLTRRISAIHVGMEDEETSAKKDYAELLNRVITSQLIVQEALNIGFDELPAVETEIESVSTELLLSRLMELALADVEPDPKEVKELYGKMSREMLLATVKFKSQEDALSFEKGAGSKQAFGELVQRFTEEGRAEASEGEFMQLKDLLPRVAQAVFDMKVGSVSRIFSGPDGFFLFHLEQERFVDDPEVEEEARQMILGPVKKEAAREYADRLEAKHCTVDEGLLRSADFENERTGFLSLGRKKRSDLKDLLRDDRVVATVHTDPPFTITIGELATEVQDAYFHGIETAIEKRDLNGEKRLILKNILTKKAAVAEARELGLDESDEYRDTIEEYTRSVLFNTFVNKVIAPDVTIEEDEVRQYYAENIGDFSSPRMLNMQGLAFQSLDGAQAALKKIQKGADFKWVSANSPGLVAKGTDGVFDFAGAPLTVSALPEEIRKQAGKAERGDALLYSDPDGFHYAIVVEKVFPETPQAYETARAPIARILFEQKARLLIDEWSEKLKEAYETRIFVVESEG